MTVKSIQHTAVLTITLALTTFLPGRTQAAPLTTATHSNSTLSQTSKPPATATRQSSTIEQLHLNNQQKQKIRAIMLQRRRAVEAVLTKPERTQLNQQIQSGKKLGQALQTLNLTATQKQRISATLQTYNQQIKGVLTRQQQQQLDALLHQRQQSVSQGIE
jgi:Spy/CpxP family protein refolding chaperone